MCRFVRYNVHCKVTVIFGKGYKYNYIVGSFIVYTSDLTQIGHVHQTTVWRQYSFRQVHVFLHQSIYQNLVNLFNLYHAAQIYMRSCQQSILCIQQKQTGHPCQMHQSQTNKFDESSEGKRYLLRDHLECSQPEIQGDGRRTAGSFR